MRALVVDTPRQNLPEGMNTLLIEVGWELTRVGSYHEALDVAKANSVDAVVMSAPDEPCETSNGENGHQDFTRLLRLIDAQRLAAVMVTSRPRALWGDLSTVIDIVDPTVCLAELRGRLVMIERYHLQFRRMAQELNNMERLGKRLNQHFREIDQEMRLAGRLQRDFLPQVKKPIDGIQFASVYRPVSWVSGDIYDVFRVDEEHTGFYVADAVGHGMAASLLTIFIKRAIVAKQVQGDGYTLLTPSQTLETLNSALVDQSLPSCQFVTACYGLLNHKTRVLTYVRGGHPYPILMTADGTISDLKTPGGLLGIFKGEEFPTFEIQLQMGDKLLMYTDGVELAFQEDAAQALDTSAYHKTFQDLAGLPIQEMLHRIDAQLDGETGSLNPRDDVTIVGLEVLADAVE